MSRFKVGQSVVCINADVLYPNAIGLIPPLRKGAIYVIHNTRTEECCGLAVVDVGLGASSPTNFCRCGKQGKNENGIWWCAEFRFAPLQEDTNEEELKEVTFTEIKKSIPALSEN